MTTPDILKIPLTIKLYVVLPLPLTPPTFIPTQLKVILGSIDNVVLTLLAPFIVIFPVKVRVPLPFKVEDWLLLLPVAKEAAVQIVFNVKVSFKSIKIPPVIAIVLVPIIVGEAEVRASVLVDAMAVVMLPVKFAVPEPDVVKLPAQLTLLAVIARVEPTAIVILPAIVNALPPATVAIPVTVDNEAHVLAALTVLVAPARIVTLSSASGIKSASVPLVNVQLAATFQLPVAELDEKFA